MLLVLPSSLANVAARWPPVAYARDLITWVYNTIAKSGTKKAGKVSPPALAPVTSLRPSVASGSFWLNRSCPSNVRREFKLNCGNGKRVET